VECNAGSDVEWWSARSGECGPGLGLHCPKCERSVILKRGRIKIAHFAHKPPTDCTWAKGETLAHLEAKKLFKDAFELRGLRAEVELIVPSLPNDRRADVMVWSPSGVRVAIELQHTTIGIEEIEARSFSYAREGIAQAWMPFLRPSVWENAETRSGSDDAGNMFIEKYPARPFERWAHLLHLGRLWFFNPADRTLWRGHFDEHEIWVEESSWYAEGGEEMYGGGFGRTSKRWKELTLWGPYSLHHVKIKIVPRMQWWKGRYKVPACRVATLVAEGEAK
jgi:competence protein CoiA